MYMDVDLSVSGMSCTHPFTSRITSRNRRPSDTGELPTQNPLKITCGLQWSEHVKYGGREFNTVRPTRRLPRYSTANSTTRTVWTTWAGRCSRSPPTLRSTIWASWCWTSSSSTPWSSTCLRSCSWASHLSTPIEPLQSHISHQRALVRHVDKFVNVHRYEDQLSAAKQMS